MIHKRTELEDCNEPRLREERAMDGLNISSRVLKKMKDFQTRNHNTSATDVFSEQNFV